MESRRLHWIVATTLLSSFVIFNGRSQTPAEFEEPEVDWAAWDTFAEDDGGKRTFVTSLSKEGGGEWWLEGVKVLDIDGDGDNDIFETIQEGGFNLYVNDNGSLKSMFTTSETLVELARHLPTNPVEFRTIDKNCCEDGAEEVATYSYSVDDGKIEYHVHRIEIIQPGTLDLYRNLPPSYFVVIDDDTELTNGPGGHIPLHKYNKGSVGYATASVKGRDGAIWWKVYMKESDYKLRMGWLKKDQVKTSYQR